MSYLIVSNPSYVGGAERMLIKIAVGLKQSDFGPIIATRSEKLYQEFSALGTQTFFYRAREMRRTINPVRLILIVVSLISINRKIFVLIRKYKPVFVYTLSWDSFLVSVFAAKLARIPLVYHAHSLLKPRWITRVVFRNLVTPFVNLTIAVSDAVKNHYVTHFGLPARKIRRIYNGMTQPRPIAPPENQRNKIVVGTAARIEPSKGLHVLVEAAQLVLRSCSNVEFLIVGDISSHRHSAYKEELVQQIQANCSKVIKLIGWQEQIEDVIARMDIFVCPSIEPEGLPLSILEAMSLRKPIIASAVGGIPELVVTNETGLLIAAGDAHALAQAICRLVENRPLRQKMGSQGQKRAQQVFSYQQFRDEILAAFRAVAGSQ
jgi:glycosyltransferase involved in cell wall biosynthesis